MIKIKKRILFFIESFSGGGAERVLLTILRNLDMAKFDVTVLVINDCGVYSKDFHHLGVKIVPVLNSKYPLVNKIKYKLVYNYLPPKLVAKWLFRGIEADTYVAFVEGYCTKVLSYLHPNKRKIAWVHIDLTNFPWPIKKGIYKNVNEERAAYQNFDLAIGVSNDVTNVLRNFYELSNIKTIYNPIDEKKIIEMSAQQCNIKKDKSTFNIVSVGRLTCQKGYDKLIDLMPYILGCNPYVQLYIIGEGEERKNLENQISKLGLNDKVILTGFMDNPYSLMKDMDLFVCSSIAEGFSLVIAEAMICGLPIVSMECAGPNELLGYGEYGILCSDYYELADTIVRISQDENLRRELCEKSQKRAMDFNTRNIVRSIEEVL